jgi:hypothetical protein
MSLRLATVNENARSALDCGSSSYRFPPSIHTANVQGVRKKSGSCCYRSPKYLRHSHFHSRGTDSTEESMGRKSKSKGKVQKQEVRRRASRGGTRWRARPGRQFRRDTRWCTVS